MQSTLAREPIERHLVKDTPVMLITGSRKGIGEHLVHYYLEKGFKIVGCSRQKSALKNVNYKHYCLDVADETAAKKLFMEIRKNYGRLNVLINNAGVASMNHALLTPVATVRRILDTNVAGTFLFSREAAKLMRKRGGRIINFTSIAVPLKLDGEAAYASSKAAVTTLTHVLAREFAPWNVTVNAVGPGPVKTDLLRGVPEQKIVQLLARQAISRLTSLSDITNVIDFFLKPESNFITGQVIFLGGV